MAVVRQSVQESRRQRGVGKDFRPLGKSQVRIGDDVELYTQLLRRPTLRRFHLVPLGEFSERWKAKALMALKSGWSPKEIISASWGLWNDPDEAKRIRIELRGHTETRIRELGDEGLKTLTRKQVRSGVPE